MRSRTGFMTFSRALLVVHGQKFFNMFTDTFCRSRALFRQKHQKYQKLCVHGHFFAGSRALFCKMFTGTFKIHGHFFTVHGHFFGFTGKFGLKSSRASAKCSRALLGNCSRPLFKCLREKKTLGQTPGGIWFKSCIRGVVVW